MFTKQAKGNKNLKSWHNFVVHSAYYFFQPLLSFLISSLIRDMQHSAIASTVPRASHSTNLQRTFFSSLPCEDCFHVTKSRLPQIAATLPFLNIHYVTHVIDAHSRRLFVSKRRASTASYNVETWRIRSENRYASCEKTRSLVTSAVIAIKRL